MLSRFRIPIITVLLVLFIDQFIKIYIKLHYPLGQVTRVTDWFIIHFTENPGMAFGYEFGGNTGKLLLSIFRILACIGGIWYVRYITLKKEHPGFIFSISMILAGAMGNIFDSAFYGLFFDRGTMFDPDMQEYLPYTGVARLSSEGYAPSMFGCVVDMFYFPIIEGTFPSWLPLWGGEPFQFFRPIFNLADASISIGVIILILFHKKFSSKQGNTTAENTPGTDNIINAQL